MRVEGVGMPGQYRGCGGGAYLVLEAVCGLDCFVVDGFVVGGGQFIQLSAASLESLRGQQSEVGACQ